MRFSIEMPEGEDAVAVWDDPRALRFLDGLIIRADDALHDIVLRDADLLDDSEWFQHARKTTQDLLLELCELARVAAWDSARPDRRAWRVSTAAEAERALRIANSPLKVLVENSLRDGALLEVAVRLLAAELLRQLWVNPPVPPAIELLHSGGTGDMPRFMEQEANNTRAANLPLRLIVVVDPDRKSPEQSPSPAAERVRQEALRHGAKPFILTKHEAENYIPNFHWIAEIDRDPRNPHWADCMTALLSMSTDDRDYCDMEKRGCKKVPVGYDKERPYHLEVLRQRVRQESKPAALNAMAVDLRARDHAGDLKAILDLIDQER